MENILLRFEFDPQRRAVGNTKPGTLFIEARIQGTSKRVRLSTGIKLMKPQHSDKAGFTCINHPLAVAVTAKAWRIFREVEAFVLSESCKSLEDVRRWHKGGDGDEVVSVIGFMETEMRRMDFSLGAIKYHRSFIRKVADFGRCRTFKDFTPSSISVIRCSFVTLSPAA
jgi:hypothetical protein